MQHDFHFISKKDPKVKKAYNDILNILKEVQDLVRKKFTFRFDVVGSYKRNMITYDAKSNVGYDFDFNIEVMEILRKVLEEKIYDYGKLPIVPMSFVGKLCEKELFHYFEKKGIAMLHVILEAKRETIMARIENDPIRDKDAQSQQKAKVDWQMKYLKAEYPNAIKIDAEDKSIHAIANEIVSFL